MKTKLTLIIALAGCFLCRNIFALTGAIYTTNVACNGVDLNIYGAKDEVYVNGGTGPHRWQWSPGWHVLCEGYLA